MNDPHRPNPCAVAQLELIMQEVQHLVAHPRIQQKTWVARAKQWLPLLRIIRSELIDQPQSAVPDNDTAVSAQNNGAILVEINAEHGQTFLSVALSDVQQVAVYRGDEPGYARVRGAHSGFTLKDGRKFLTHADEAQRIVDALRRGDDISTDSPLPRNTSTLHSTSIRSTHSAVPKAHIRRYAITL